MSRRAWRVVIESRHCAHVSGYGVRELLTEMRGRPPVWSSLSRAWVTTEETARDLIARAERQGVQVEVESYLRVQVIPEVSPVVVPTPEPEPLLW